MAFVTITQGRDFEYDIFLQNEDETPKDITGFSLIKLKKKNDDGTIKEFFNPLTAAVDEVQALAFSGTPDAGSFKLEYTSASGIKEKTAAILFSDDAAAVQVAIRALKCFSAMTVSGSFAAGFVLTYTAADGGRNQALPAVTDATTLKVATVLVVVTPSVTTEGVSEKGVDVIEAKAGHLKVKGGEDDSLALVKALDQTGVLVVRIAAQDLNIEPIENLYSVVEDPLT